MNKANCYACIHRRNVPGDAHSACAHPATGTSGDMFDGIVALLDGRAVKAARQLNIIANPHGVRSGWFNWPGNFDPTWLENCEGFTTKEQPK